VAAANLPVALAESGPEPPARLPGATVRHAGESGELARGIAYDALGRRLGPNRPAAGVYFVRSGPGLRRIVALPNPGP
jgi:hypothetical protein